MKNYRIKIDIDNSGEETYIIQREDIFQWVNLNIYSHVLKEYAFKKLNYLKSREVVESKYIY